MENLDSERSLYIEAITQEVIRFTARNFCYFTRKIQ